MNKIATILLCLLMAFMLVACGETDNSGNSGNGGQSGNQGSQSGEYYPDKEVRGQNTFSLAKKSYNGNDAVLTLKLGGSEIKTAGFKIEVHFDVKITVNDISPTSEFMSMTENHEKAGILTLLWAGTSNLTEATDICDISLNINDATDLTFKIEIAYGGLGYIDETSIPPVKSIRGNVNDFKLA